MRLCAMEHMVPGDTFAERARHLREAGCEAVELTVGDGGPLLGSLRARVPEIVQGCQEFGLRAAVVTTRIADLLDQDPARRAAAMAALRDNLEVAAAVGAIGVLLVPRFGSPSLPDLSPYATAHQLEHRLLVAQLREMAGDAECLGVQIILEPLRRAAGQFLNTVAHALQICQEVESPAIRIVIDTFQSQHEEASIPEAIGRAGATLTHVHIADSNRRLPPQGSLDFASIVQALRAIDYDGVLSFECEIPGPWRPEFEAAVRHMKSFGG